MILCSISQLCFHIHILDLASGHIAALKKAEQSNGCLVYNLGTGTGYSVLEAVKAFEAASEKEVKYRKVRANGHFSLLKVSKS